jgi:predicted AAA+ superfamily ATPase
MEIEQSKIYYLVYLNGPRQVGKSTLVQMFKNSNYISFDSPLAISSAKVDSKRFFQELPMLYYEEKYCRDL